MEPARFLLNGRMLSDEKMICNPGNKTMVHPDKSKNSGGDNMESHDRTAETGADDHILDPRIQDAIGRSLKAHFDDLISSPIPDKFLVLLAELEEKERRHDA